MPAFPVAGDVSVGAGDAFNVGLLHGLREGWGAPRALRLGAAVAARLVASGQGVMGAPTWGAVAHLLEEDAP